MRNMQRVMPMLFKLPKMEEGTSPIFVRTESH
jgi:hypothetical protein